MRSSYVVDVLARSLARYLTRSYREIADQAKLESNFGFSRRILDNLCSALGPHKHGTSQRVLKFGASVWYY